MSFFDTETTGIPKNWEAPVTDLSNWPRMVQIAYLGYKRKVKKISGLIIWLDRKDSQLGMITDIG